MRSSNFYQDDKQSCANGLILQNKALREKKSSQSGFQDQHKKSTKTDGDKFPLIVLSRHWRPLVRSKGRQESKGKIFCFCFFSF